jgi:predicted alpha-1,2-mannosidase
MVSAFMNIQCPSLKIKAWRMAILMTFMTQAFSYAQDPVELVYPHLDAANSRWFYFSSACRPFGMVNLSPDTELGGAWGSGYRYHTKEIKGFSHLHAWQLSGVSVMPVSGSELERLGIRNIANDYFSAFSHDRETVKPGYHSVYLERYKTTVELTSTKRVGFHRISFPGGDNNVILLNLGGTLGPSEIIHGKVEKTGDHELRGMVMNGKTRRRPNDTPVFFAIQFNRPILSLSSFSGDNQELIQGENDGAIIQLGETDDPVLMKVALSYVSSEQAVYNLSAELDHWDFDRVVDDALQEWNSWLNAIRVEGGSEQARKRFYTDLWHALQGRRIISDANGYYSDFTGSERTIRQLPLDKEGNPRYNHYNSDSFWGAQWTLNTLWHLAYPDVSSEFCNSLLTYYSDGGLIPRGPSGGNYTYVMTGASSTPFLVSAYQKGIRDFDIQLAYEGMKKNHHPGGMMDHSGYEHTNTGSGGVRYYMSRGYVPFPIPVNAKAFHKQGAGQTLEYAYQDWTLAQLAKALNRNEEYRYYLHRSLNYSNVFDTVSGYMRPKDENGQWMKNYDPGSYAEGFVESNGYQGTWYVPHDIEGLAELMGGKEILIKRLDEAFESSRISGFTSGKKHADETKKENRRIPINYGNQPSIHTAFIFHEAGAPWLTQKWSRAVVDSVYSGLSPDYGYSGDEDQGLMGSLAVLMKIGLFQLNGGTEEDPVYLIGSPVFDRITIDLNNEYYPGEEFVIEVKNNSPKNIYVQEALLNNMPLKQLQVRHSQVVNGGTLTLFMGEHPVKHLGNLY